MSALGQKRPLKYEQILACERLLSQFGAGLAYEFPNGMRLSAQYRYFATSEADFGPGGEVKIESNDFLLGFTVPLGGQR